MQIHELNTFTGTPGSGDWLAMDNGTETTKVAASNVGVSTPMTLAEAQTGTVTDQRVISPKILHDYVSSAGVYYGTSSTAASTTTKVVDCTGFKLETGAMIAINFTNAHTSTAASYLNVNSTGAKRIRRAGSSTQAVGYLWEAGDTVMFVYDGSSWLLTGLEADIDASVITQYQNLGWTQD